MFTQPLDNFKQVLDHLIVNKSIKIEGIYAVWTHGHCSLLDTKPDKHQLQAALILQLST